MNEIALLIPSRGRPAAITELLGMLQKAPVDVFVGYDEDDDTKVMPAFPNVEYVIRPRMQLSPWTNLLASMTWDRYPILGSLGDDHRPRTEGWTVAVSAAMDEIGSGLVYTADGLQDENLPTAPFWSADVIKALGWFFPPRQQHLWCDNFWLAFARDLGRVRYLPHVLIEHMHPSAGKAEYDEVSAANDSHNDADRAAFEAYLRSPDYQLDLRRVTAAIAARV
ncbi:MAG: hypothetical protein KGR26_01325 [Cyanobacteria bacterium REEB65]|nr:hypothetical protein [Cyanobacteria bacterium REEB65]